ncbi:MAG: 2,3-bisphosphoglycerate-independent phosphoglycerate mutase [Oscillibacter sp.]|nr:2,3-bisphosphoglycerate-independent phosphoglycerate mutase [Oscillibacter sp.]
MKKTPTTLIILDGLGLADGRLSALGESTRTAPHGADETLPGGAVSGGNAVRLAHTPRLDGFLQKYASTTLSASGADVGLLPGQPGESETGHANLGAGRVVPQVLPRILSAIRDGSFYQNPVLLNAMGKCRERGTALHLCGLLSDGGVHAHTQFLSALLRMAKEQGLERVWLHPFLDGIDVPDGSGASYLRQAEAVCRETGVGKIATVMGRFYAMDRDCYWDRIEQVYDAMVYGESARTASDPAAAAEQSRSWGFSDAAMEPVVCDARGTISDDDTVVCFNVRPDRVRQLARALTEDAFDGFTRQIFPLTFISFAECGLPGVEEAFPRPPVPQCLGEVLSGLGLTQLRIGESCKRAHLTTLFDGGAKDPFPGEDREFVPSARAGDEAPEMAAEQVCAGCVERLESGAYDFIVVNFANCDVIGHRGDLAAAVRAVEAVDACAGRVVDATLKMGGIAMLVGSHGNAERMLDETGEPTGVNSTDPVPCILCGAGKRLRPGRLADAAPTLLDVMGFNCPDEMDGRTLILE